MKRTALALAASATLVACGDGIRTAPRLIEVSASPDRQWYRTGQPVEVTGEVTYIDGALVDGAEIVWTVAPAGAASPDATGPTAATFVLDAEGQVTITGCLADDDAVCASVELRVDDGSPLLEIESPAPGAELSDADGIVVRGSVSDSGGARVFVGGELVELDDLGRFETTAPASFGINHLSVTASDGLTEETTVAMDVLWAPAFSPALAEDGTPHLRLEDGIALSFGQMLFDDGEALDPAAEPLVTRDLADILALVASRMPLAERIPDPVVDEPSFYLRVPTAVTGPVESSIDVTPDGVEIFFRLSELQLTTEGTLDFGDSTLDLTGEVVASVAATARIDVGKASEAEPTEVELANLWLVLETVNGDFVSDETDAVFLLAEGALRTTIEEQLLTGVEDTLATALPAVLEDLLAGLDAGLADREFVLDAAILPAPITFLIDGRLATVAAQQGVELLAVLRTSLGTTTESVHPDSRGVALLQPPESEPAGFFRDKSLQVGIRLALLNGLLHALWSSGALEIDLSEQISPDLIEGGRLSAKIAPIVRPPRPGETDRLVLSLGQLEVELELPDGDVARFGVSLDTAIDADIVDGALTVVAPGEPRIRVWTIDPAANAFYSEELISTVLAIQWEDIRDSVLGGLSFDLPVPTLSALGELAPDLAALTLSVDLAEPLALRRGTILLHGSLQGTLPAP